MGALRCRVDDRLLHSEVLYAELGARPDQLVLASHLTWLQAAELSLVPAPTHVEVVVPSKVAAVAQAATTLVVLGTVLDLTEAIRAGFEPDVVALANRVRRPGTGALSATFWVDETERRQLGELLAQGTPLVVQRVPSDPPQVLTREALTAAAEEAAAEELKTRP